MEWYGEHNFEKVQWYFCKFAVFQWYMRNYPLKVCLPILHHPILDVGIPPEHQQIPLRLDLRTRLVLSCLLQMPLQIASGLLRRLSDSIYSQAPPDARETPLATAAAVNDTAITDSDQDATPGNLSLTLPDPPAPQEIVSADANPPQPTSPLDNFATRSVHQANARRRQPSITISTPDVNMQTALRKRILDIQILALPEREKARRIQV